MASSERGVIVHLKDLGPLVWCCKTVNTCRGVDRWLQENLQNGSTVELEFGHLRIPIVIQVRPNVEHGQHASDDKVHSPES
jgi:predicted metal-binding transcription factor (methanogenesis marker protein 9)